MAASASKSLTAGDSGNYGTTPFLLCKIKAFWVELWVACTIGLLVFTMCHLHDCHSIAKAGVETLFGDVLMLKMTGFVSNGVNGATWYLSSMIICCAAVYPLIRKVGISPVYIVPGMVILGGMYLTDGAEYGLAWVTHWMGFTYKGNVRAFAELLTGVSLFPIAAMVSRVNMGRLCRMAFTLVKWACWGGMLLYALHPLCHRVGLVFFCICAALTLSFSRVCSDAGWYQSRFVIWLGRLSLPLYLSHYFYAKNLGFLVPGSYSPSAKLAIYLACSLATALLVMGTAKYIRHRWLPEHSRQ